MDVYKVLPDTITNEEKQKAQNDRQITIRVNPIEGLTSNYDYEKGQWKKFLLAIECLGQLM